jgi:AcrR family transcriptional regulator
MAKARTATGGKRMANAPTKRDRPLTPDAIVAAALGLVEAEGLAAMSTRRLGQALGCQAMSIYYHFPSKQHLLDALVDHAIADVPIPPPGPAPVERLRRLAHAYRAMAHRHPQLFPLVAVHRLNTPTGVRFVEAVLALVEAVVPERERAARYFRALGYYLVGAALDETTGYAKGPSAAAPVSDEYVAMHCPRLLAASPYFKQAHWDATFALGLDALLAEMASGTIAPPPVPRPRVRPKTQRAPD